MNILHCDTVGMRYGNGSEILHDISFDLERGDFCFLTGPSGAGKTTLLSLFFLGQYSTRGIIKVFGKDVSDEKITSRSERAKLRSRIGVVFQDFRLISHATVYENVMLPLRIKGHKERVFHKDVNDLLEWVGLGGKENAFPPTLSGGEQQRVAIARAVATQPELLIADEPTGNVDPAMAARLLHLLTELNQLGTAVLVATHDPQLAAQYKARIVHLEGGHLVEGTISNNISTQEGLDGVSRF